MYIPTVLLTHPSRHSRLGALLLLAASAVFCVSPLAGEPRVSPPEDRAIGREASGSGVPAGRTFRAFLPRPDAAAEEPSGHIIQLLLDRQEKDGYESYLIQVLFRGAPAREHVQRVYPDRVEVDFLDAGKPSMRLARVRGGVVEATSLEEFHYRDTDKLKQLVRLTLYTPARPSLRIRNTLDRTLIHFRLDRPARVERPAGKPSENGHQTVPPENSRSGRPESTAP